MSAAPGSKDDPRPALQAAAAQLSLTLDARQVEALVDFLGLLVRWNATYNLTAVRERPAMVAHHLLDALAVVPALRRQLASMGIGDGARLLDVGSGGGLPGVVLAIACPGLEVTCIDAVGKKAAFIRQVAATLRWPRLRAVHGRVESLQGSGFDIVTSRAFATLADFVRLTRTSRAPRGVWMAMKGRVPQEEIGALPPDIEVFHVEPIEVPGLDAQRCIVWMRLRDTEGALAAAI